jgi:HAD superfamily hydrolase (TIGR01484 family)
MTILALDIDGTLLNPNKEVDYHFLNDLIQLSKFCVNQKIKTILVTGRSLEEVYKDSSLIEILKPIFIVTNCGMDIYKKTKNNYTKQKTYEKFLNLTCDKELLDCQKLIMNILPGLKLQELHRQFKFKKSYYIDGIDLKILQDKKEDINKLFVNSEIIVTFCNIEPHYLDLQHKNATKFGALNYVIREELKLSLDEVYYFGDNGNDIPCFLNLKKSYLFNLFEESLKWFYKIDTNNKFLNKFPGPESILSTISQ